MKKQETFFVQVEHWCPLLPGKNKTVNDEVTPVKVGVFTEKNCRQPRKFIYLRIIKMFFIQ